MLTTSETSKRRFERSWKRDRQKDRGTDRKNWWCCTWAFA